MKAGWAIAGALYAVFGGFAAALIFNESFAEWLHHEGEIIGANMREAMR